MLEDDDELTELLADEDRVRDALLAAVDGQQVPPARTDLGEIVRRGRRRARLQVVSASVAAVVLIGAVALGATLLGRLGASDRTSAAGPGTSLPMTSQTLSTTSNPPTSDGNQDFYGPDAACIFPAMAGPAKWVPLSTAKLTTFTARTIALQPGAAAQVRPAVAGELDEVGRTASQSVVVDWHGQQTLVSVSTSVYGGDEGMAVAQDLKSEQPMPTDCAGTSSIHQVNRTMLAVEYPAVAVSADGATYLRVRLYAQDGIRYDVTEAVNAASFVSPTVPSSGPEVPPSKVYPTGFAWPPALSMAQLVEVAIGVANAP
jgi:hypothetical protein